MSKRTARRGIVHLLIGRLLVRVQSGEQVRASFLSRWFPFSSPSAPRKARQAERAAQLRYLARHDVSRLDMLDWTPERLDRLAAELWPDDHA